MRPHDVFAGLLFSPKPVPPGDCCFWNREDPPLLPPTPIPALPAALLNKPKPLLLAPVAAALSSENPVAAPAAVPSTAPDAVDDAAGAAGRDFCPKSDGFVGGRPAVDDDPAPGAADDDDDDDDDPSLAPITVADRPMLGRGKGKGTLSSPDLSSASGCCCCCCDLLADTGSARGARERLLSASASPPANKGEPSSSNEGASNDGTPAATAALEEALGAGAGADATAVCSFGSERGIGAGAGGVC